ncbi:NAD(P)/FAD-dependent oxidoreductase [Brachybacterium sp. AOP25-B2-12]|uniref:NAD(P)/FAD-dependent oxidoreductase n=1 Tax=Brachybacterium sp. AOP25-B2-12 TaxID=3457710 RepID=UPI004033C750
MTASTTPAHDAPGHATPAHGTPDHAPEHDIHTPHAIAADAPRAYDTVVIGGGTAGLSAALLLGRARRRVLVIDAGRPRNRFAAHMHGALGLDGMPPLELLARGRAELEHYDVEVVTGEVASIREVTRGLAVRREKDIGNGDGNEDGHGHGHGHGNVDGDDGEGNVVYTRSVLVASGIEDHLPGIDGLDALWGGDVFACPYCHGWEVRGRRLGVLATSPMSAHQALLARQWSEDLTVFLAAGAELPREARGRLAARGVVVVEDPAVAAESTGGRLTGIRTADGTVHPLDALLVSPALQPRDRFLAEIAPVRVDTLVGSFLQVDANGRTSPPGSGRPGTWSIRG